MRRGREVGGERTSWMRGRRRALGRRRRIFGLPSFGRVSSAWREKAVNELTRMSSPAPHNSRPPNLRTNPHSVSPARLTQHPPKHLSRTIRKELKPRRRAPRQYARRGDDHRNGHIHKDGPARAGARRVRPRRAHERGGDPDRGHAARVVVPLRDGVAARRGEPLAHQVVRPEALRLARDRELPRGR